MTKPPKDSPAGLLSIALGGYPTASDTERLGAIWQLQRRLAEEEDQIAFTMRLHGLTWQDIADTFHISRQAAHQRFAQSAGLIDKLKEATNGTQSTSRPKP